MKAQRIRKGLWLGSLGLAVGVVAVGAVAVLDKPDAAQADTRWADSALVAYKAREPKRMLPAPVEIGDIETLFMNPEWKERWFPFTGPRIPPKVVEQPVATEVVKGPTGLEAIGRVRLLLYQPAAVPGQPATDSIVFWEFADKRSAEFSPGQFIAQKGAPGRFRLVDVVRTEPGKSRWKIVYEVYDDPAGKPVSSGELLHDAEPKYDPEGPIRFPKKPVPAPAAPGTAPAAPGAPGAPAASAAPGTGVIVVGGEPGSGAGPGPTGSSPDDWRLDIREVGRGRKRVEVGDAAWVALKDKNVEKLLEDVRTEPYNEGGVRGLRIMPQGAGSLADKFDVKRGDILVSINSQPVASRDDAIRIARGIPPEAALVTVEIDRDGRRLTYEVDPRDPKTRRAAASVAPR